MPIYRDKAKGCWRFEFNRRIAGQRFRVRKRLPKTWDRSKADAFDRAESERLYGIATGVSKPEASIEHAVALYLTERLPELKHGRKTATELALVFPFYRGKPMSALPAVCAAIRKAWTGVFAPATIRNRIRYLTAACRWAWKKHHVCEHNPAERVQVPQVNNERQVYTDRAGMLLIAQAANPCREARALIRIGFYTGMRLGEILRCEVDRAAGLLKLPDTKNGEPRWIPVHPRIRPALRYLPFTLARSTLEKRYRLFRGAVGMGHLHFHDLRHASAAEMINSGIDLYTVGAVLGHKSTQSTKRYAHLQTATLQAAILKIGRRA